MDTFQCQRERELLWKIRDFAFRVKQPESFRGLWDVDILEILTGHLSCSFIEQHILSVLICDDHAVTNTIKNRIHQAVLCL